MAKKHETSCNADTSEMIDDHWKKISASLSKLENDAIYLRENLPVDKDENSLLSDMIFSVMRFRDKAKKFGRKIAPV